MKIKKLVLHNFGVYAGTNIFEFKGEKPIVLIGGMNGRGKTTFLEAILLAMYSSNSFAYTEGTYKTYGQYLKSFVNRLDGTYKTYVELEFELSDNEKYNVHREWRGDVKRVHESVNVKLNDESNSFLAENWLMFIENILPSGLSNFFFFDGEKIAALAEEDTNEQMKESIRTLLGINVVDRLEGDLKRIKNRKEKENEKKYDLNETNRLKSNKEKLEIQLEDIDNQIAELNDKISKLEKRIELAKINYTAKGGDIVEKRQRLFQQKSELNAKINMLNEQLNDMSSSGLPLIMVQRLLKEIERHVKQEKQNKENEIVIRSFHRFYNEYANKHGKGFPDIEEFMKYMKLNMETKEVEKVYNFSDTSFFHICSLNNTLLDELKNKTIEIIEDKKKLQKRLDEIDSYLEVEIDEKAINKIYKKIIKLEKDKSNLEVDRDELIRKRPSINGELIKVTNEFNKYVEEMLSTLEMSDDNDRVVKYIHKVIDVFEQYKICLQKRKVNVLAETMTACYKQLANKKTLIKYIKMDPKTLDFYYYNEIGEVVPKNRLSAGEKQLMVVSLLWSLAICSKRKLPVIIDTPLSRLDSKHRIAFIKTYFPNASDQTIILSTDSEIFGKYYEALKPNIGDEFTLCYNDDTKSTSIQIGYMMEETKW